MTTTKVLRWSQADIARVRERVDDEFTQTFSLLPEFRLAILSTSDGRALTGRFSGTGNKDRAAAIVSSILAICETAGKEFATGRCTSAIVVAENAHVVALRVGNKSSPFVLAVAMEDSILLGAVLRLTADLGERLAKIVTEESAVAA